MEKRNGFGGQLDGPGDAVTVPVARTGAKLVLYRSDGGSVDRFCKVFEQVRGRVSDADAATIAGYWHQLKGKAPSSRVPVVLIQPDWPGRLPARSEWQPELDRAIEQSRRGEPIPQGALDNSIRLICVLEGFLARAHWGLLDEGAVVAFSPQLVDAYCERELSQEIACWLAKVYTLAVGDEAAVQRWREARVPISRFNRPVLEEINKGAHADEDPAVVEHWRTRLTVSECVIHLTELWSGPLDANSRG